MSTLFGWIFFHPRFVFRSSRDHRVVDAGDHGARERYDERDVRSRRERHAPPVSVWPGSCLVPRFSESRGVQSRRARTSSTAPIRRKANRTPRRLVFSSGVSCAGPDGRARRNAGPSPGWARPSHPQGVGTGAEGHSASRSRKVLPGGPASSPPAGLARVRRRCDAMNASLADEKKTKRRLAARAERISAGKGEIAPSRDRQCRCC